MKVNVLGILLSLSSVCADQAWEDYCLKVNQEFNVLFGKTNANLSDIMDYGRRAYNLEKLEEALRDAQEKLEPKPNLIEACTMIAISPAADDLGEFPKLQATIDKTPNIMNCLLVPSTSVFKDPNQIYMALAALYRKDRVIPELWNWTMLNADLTNANNFGWVLAANNIPFLHDLYSREIRLNPEMPLPKINLALAESVVYQLAAGDADKSFEWLIDKGFDPKSIIWECSEISKSPKVIKLLREYKAKIAFTECNLKDIIHRKVKSLYYLVTEHVTAGGDVAKILPKDSLEYGFVFHTFSGDDADLYDTLGKKGIEVHADNACKYQAAYRARNKFSNAKINGPACCAYLDCDPANLMGILQDFPDAIPKGSKCSLYYKGNECRNASDEDLRKIARWAERRDIAFHIFLFIEAFRRRHIELLGILNSVPEEMKDGLYITASRDNDIEMIKNLADFGVSISKEGCWKAMSYAVPEIQEMLNSPNLCGTVSFDLSQDYSSEGDACWPYGWDCLDWKKKIWPAAATKEGLENMIKEQQWPLALVVYRALWEKSPDNVRRAPTALWEVLHNDIKADLMRYAPLCLMLDMLEEGSIERLSEDELKEISKGALKSEHQLQCWKNILRMNKVREASGIEILSELPLSPFQRTCLSLAAYRGGDFFFDQRSFENVGAQVFIEFFRIMVAEIGKTPSRVEIKERVKKLSPIPMYQFNMLMWIRAAENGLDKEGKDVENEEIATETFNEFEDKEGLVNIYFLEYLAKRNFFKLFRQLFQARPVPPSQIALYYICGHGNLEWIKMIYNLLEVFPDERAKAHAAAKGHYYVVGYINNISDRHRLAIKIKGLKGDNVALYMDKLTHQMRELQLNENENPYDNLEIVDCVRQMSGNFPNEELLSGEVLEVVQLIKNKSTRNAQRDLDDAEGK